MKEPRQLEAHLLERGSRVAADAQLLHVDGQQRRELSGPRVRTPHHGLQVRDLDVRVALGRGEALVAEQRLDVADVGAVLEEVRRHAVPEGVRVTRFFTPAWRVQRRTIVSSVAR